jgi:BASS family bile acid:Na+ symporter
MEGSVIIEVGLPIALALVMVGVGLTLTMDDFKEQRDKNLSVIVLALLGSAVIVPALAFPLATVMGAPAAVAVGLVLAASTPNGATSSLFSYLSRGNVAVAIVATALTGFLSILAIPFWVNLALDIWGDDLESSNVTVPFMDVVGLLMAIVLVPVTIGLIIKAKKPETALKMERYLSLFGIAVVLFLIISVFIDLGDQRWPMLRAAGPVSLVLGFVCAGVGLLLGQFAGKSKSIQNTVAIAQGLTVKNITLGILIGLTVMESEEIATPSAVFALLMYVPALLLVRQARKWIPAPEIGPPLVIHRASNPR